MGDFVTLVYSISRRAVHLHHNAAKSRVFFFKVQLDLVFTFLEAMIAALPWNTTTSAAPTTLEGVDGESRDHLTRWTAILNALQTVLETMQEWTNDQVNYSPLSNITLGTLDNYFSVQHHTCTRELNSTIQNSGKELLAGLMLEYGRSSIPNTNT